jgi:hypothetical protein
LSRDEEKHVSGAVDERIHKETDKWKNRQINKETEKETYKILLECRSEVELVSG